MNVISRSGGAVDNGPGFISCFELPLDRLHRSQGYYLPDEVCAEGADIDNEASSPSVVSSYAKLLIIRAVRSGSIVNREYVARAVLFFRNTSTSP